MPPPSHTTVKINFGGVARSSRLHQCVAEINPIALFGRPVVEVEEVGIGRRVVGKGHGVIGDESLLDVTRPPEEASGTSCVYG